ncbi:pfkB-like carbohydrate kinase family protein [Abeliophyllum distichum]|uniref:PfkB-like carbohydrate kinase family protein n=1 Tax=Abeliophyllum distichum TaxID=126358 RepID=A0ABD1P8H0_9LAMI
MEDKVKMEAKFQGFLQAAHRDLPLSLNKGEQVLDNEAEPVVIGGMVLDINASPSMPANPRTTTPGKVLYALGGVARNVAECMSKLGTKPFMISALGLDMAGNLLLEHWRSAGLSIEGIQRHQHIETAIVCNIFDGKGELAAAVASVEALEKFLTPEWIEQFKSDICSAPVLMVDANLSPPALVACCQMAAECETPVWFEPVSVAKSKRIASVVQYISFASPNEDELVAMANALSCRDKYLPVQRDCGSTKLSTELLFQMLKPAIWVLLEKGIRVVVVTLGSDGIFLCCKARHGFKSFDFLRSKPHSFSRQLYNAVNSSCPPSRFVSSLRSNGSSMFLAVHFPALSASVVRLTGAGDCLVGGTLSSFCAGLDIMQSVAVGIAAAKTAVETETNVPAEYVLAKIADDARSVYFDAKVLFSESKL